MEPLTRSKGFPSAAGISRSHRTIWPSWATYISITGRGTGSKYVGPSGSKLRPKNILATDGQLGYGYQWWIYPSFGAYTALGRYGQTIFVIPSLDLVIVTTAQIEGHGPIYQLIEQYVVPAVQD